MKLAMVATPPDDINLQLLEQIGVRYAVHYDMYDPGRSPEEMRLLQDRYRRFQLTWTVAESGPPLDRIILGLDGWEAQTEAYKRSLEALGRAGVEVVAYNFMPQLGYDAMVVRTTYAAQTRGGARTSAFSLANLDLEGPLLRAPRIGRDRMWDHLERFLRAVLPAAENAGIRLAMHPDDPPVLARLGTDRIMSSVEDFTRLLSISASPANGFTLCMGCFAEMGSDPVDLARRFAGRYPFVHVRNIAGTAEAFEERFIDDGVIRIPEVFRAMRDVGFDGYIRSDHTPVLVTEAAGQDRGYGMQGHLHATGYIQGIIATLPTETVA